MNIKFFTIICLVSITFFFAAPTYSSEPSESITAYAFKYPLRAGYDTTLKSGGVPVDIYFNNVKILTAGKGTYCSGFTFYVAFSFLNERGRLKNFTVSQINNFQKQWFGVYPKNAEKQCVDALLDIGQGIAVKNIADLKKGDFVQFWRINKTGHSAIFLDFVYGENKNIRGIEYISSQKSTDGISPKKEYFADEHNNEGIDKYRFYAVRIIN